MNGERQSKTRPTRWLLWSVLGILLLTAAELVTRKVRLDLRERDEFVRRINAARNVVMALQLDAADEETGKPVEKLDDLVVKGKLENDSPLYSMAPDGTRKALWILLANDSSETGNHRALIISAEPYHDRRIVGNSDYSVELIREREWQGVAHELGIGMKNDRTLPPAPATGK